MHAGEMELESLSSPLHPGGAADRDGTVGSE